MRVNLEGKKQGKHKSCLIKYSLSDGEVWVESEYYLNLESGDKRRYKEKSTISNGGFLSDPNVSTGLFLICL